MIQKSEWLCINSKWRGKRMDYKKRQKALDIYIFFWGGGK